MKLLRRYRADVLLNYLQHIVSMHLAYLGGNISPVGDILSDVAQWFSNRFRGRPAVVGAERLLWLPTEARDELIRQEQSIES